MRRDGTTWNRRRDVRTELAATHGESVVDAPSSLTAVDIDEKCHNTTIRVRYTRRRFHSRDAGVLNARAQYVESCTGRNSSGSLKSKFRSSIEISVEARDGMGTGFFFSSVRNFSRMFSTSLRPRG